jgi:hypothetical protein
VPDSAAAAAAAAWCCVCCQVLSAELANGKQLDLHLPYVDKERARQREEKALQVGFKLYTALAAVAPAVEGSWRALAVSPGPKQQQCSDASRCSGCMQQRSTILHSVWDQQQLHSNDYRCRRCKQQRSTKPQVVQDQGRNIAAVVANAVADY